MTGDDSVPSDKTVWYRQDWLQNSKGNWVIADEQQVDAVPIEELEALADAWEQKADDWTPTDPHTDYTEPHLQECAQELREVIEQYD